MTTQIRNGFDNLVIYFDGAVLPYSSRRFKKLVLVMEMKVGPRADTEHSL